MAKKSKKEKETKKSEKTRSDSISLISGPQLLFLVIIFAIIFLSQNPQFFPSITSKIPLISQRQATASASLTQTASNLYSKAQEYFLQFAQNTKIPSKYTGLSEDMVVEEVVASFSQEIKDLPKTQVSRIKTEICQDIIDQATSSANQ